MDSNYYEIKKKLNSTGTRDLYLLENKATVSFLTCWMKLLCNFHVLLRRTTSMSESRPCWNKMLYPIWVEHPTVLFSFTLEDQEYYLFYRCLPYRHSHTEQHKNYKYKSSYINHVCTHSMIHSLIHSSLKYFKLWCSFTTSFKLIGSTAPEIQLFMEWISLENIKEEKLLERQSMKYLMLFHVLFQVPRIFESFKLQSCVHFWQCIFKNKKKERGT